MFKAKPVLFKYIITACIFMLILAVGFTVNNIILLRSLQRSYRERTLYLVENGFQYMEQRWQLFRINAIAIKADRAGGIQQLPQRRDPFDVQFQTGAQMLVANLRTFQFAHPEIADIVIWYERLDVFFNTNGSWSKELLSHWEQSEHFLAIDFEWIHRDERSVIYKMDGKVVYYSNYHHGTHMFIVISPQVLGTVLAQLIPSNYGRFDVTVDGAQLNISNGGPPSSAYPDIVKHGDGPLIYHFYYNPLAYSFIVNTMTVSSTAVAVGITILAAFLLLRIKSDLYDPVPHIMSQLNIEKGKENEFTLIMDAIGFMHASLEQLSFNHAISSEDSEKIRSLIDSGSSCFCALTILFEDELGCKDSKRSYAFSRTVSTFKCYPVHAISKYGFYFFFFQSEQEYEQLIECISTHMQESVGFVQCGISSLNTDLAQLNPVLDESKKAFHDAPTDGFTVQKKPTVYNAESKRGKISTSNHNKLIASAIQGEIQNIIDTMQKILHENANTSSTVTRRLMFYMYDTICMLTGLNVTKEESPRRLFLEDVIDPQLLFTLLCEDLSAQLKTIDGTDAMLEWINENLYRDISLSDMADAMNMSYSYVSVNFKTKVGMNFLEYLQKKRVEHSMDMLANSNKSVDEIALTAGFVSVNTFFRVFKKYAGITPSKYRETTRR